MSEEGKVPLPNLEDRAALAEVPVASEPEGSTTRSAADLEAVFDVPVLGHSWPGADGDQRPPQTRPRYGA